FGESAAANAAAAVGAVESLLGRRLDESAARQALASVALPGRVEVAGNEPLVILDGAHNPEAMQELVRSLRRSFEWRRAHVVLAMSEDKDVEAVGGRAAQLHDTAAGAQAVAYVARNSTTRSASPGRVAAALRRGGLTDVREFATVADAVDAARGEAR